MKITILLEGLFEVVDLAVQNDGGTIGIGIMLLTILGSMIAADAIHGRGDQLLHTADEKSFEVYAKIIPHELIRGFSAIQTCVCLLNNAINRAYQGNITPCQRRILDHVDWRGGGSEPCRKAS